MEKVIEQFHKLDPDGQRFRYATDKNDELFDFTSGVDFAKLIVVMREIRHWTGAVESTTWSAFGCQ